MTAQTEPPARSALTPWNHLIADAVVWAVLVFLLIGFRRLLLWVFRVQLSAESGTQAVVRCFGTGIRYDIQIATYIDCLVRLGISIEGMGFVVCEAFACGNPVLASALDGIPEAFVACWGDLWPGICKTDGPVCAGTLNLKQ